MQLARRHSSLCKVQLKPTPPPKEAQHHPMTLLTYNLNEGSQDDPIAEVLSQVPHGLHRRFLLQLRIHPGHISLQLLLKHRKGNNKRFYQLNVI